MEVVKSLVIGTGVLMMLPKEHEKYLWLRQLPCINQILEVPTLYGVSSHAIFTAIVVITLFNYIPLLQIRNAKVTRPFLFMQRGGCCQTTYVIDYYTIYCMTLKCPI